MSYRSFIRITAGDDGKPLGRTRLAPVAKAINGHIENRAEEIGVQLHGYDGVRVYQHLGQPGLLVEASSAAAARVAIRTTRVFLQNAGWTFRGDSNSAMKQAILSGGAR